MKRILAMLVVILLCAPARAEDGLWAPHVELLIKIEGMLKIPNDPPSTAFPTGRKNALGNYARYYIGVKLKGQTLINATFVRTDLYKTKAPAQRYIGNMGLVPKAKGCGVIRFTYDVDADKIVSLHCNPV